MDTFSLLTGIASGAAATLICQRVVIELRNRRVKRAQRLTVRIDVLDRRVQAVERQIAERVSTNAETLSKFARRLEKLEKLEGARNSVAQD